MARIRVQQEGFLHVLSANESDGENVGIGDVTDEGGAVAGSADAVITDTGNAVCFSVPIHITKPGDKNKLPDTGEAVGACDAEEATEEVRHANQEQSESLNRFPERLPSISQKRATTVVPGSDTLQETKKTRSPNWTQDETQIMIAGRGLKRRWQRLFINNIPGRRAVQCRKRLQSTFQNSVKKSLTTTASCGPAANEPNGASTSTHTVGKTNLPSSACPNLEVLCRPELMPTAFAVEQGPAAVAPAVPFPAMPDYDLHSCDDPFGDELRYLLSEDYSYFA